MEMNEVYTLSGLVLSQLSALSSTIQASRASKKAGVKLTAVDIDRISHIGPPIAKDNAVVQAMVRVIHPDLLVVITENIKDAYEEFVRALRNPELTLPERDKEEVMARFRICIELARIRRLNEGVLPGEELEHFWRSFNCDPFGC